MNLQRHRPMDGSTGVLDLLVKNASGMFFSLNPLRSYRQWGHACKSRQEACAFTLKTSTGAPWLRANSQMIFQRSLLATAFKAWVWKPFCSRKSKPRTTLRQSGATEMWPTVRACHGQSPYFGSLRCKTRSGQGHHPFDLIRNKDCRRCSSYLGPMMNKTWAVYKHYTFRRNRVRWIKKQNLPQIRKLKL